MSVQMQKQKVPEELIEKEKNSIYLCGPIRKVEDDGRGWRNNLIEEYSNEFNFVNPLDRYDPEDQEVLNDPSDFSNNSEKEQILPSEYVMSDKLAIQQCEFVFVGLPDVVARGSCMESMYAYMKGIPFFLWTIDEQKESGWMFEHAEVVHSDRDEVMEMLKKYE